MKRATGKTTRTQKLKHSLSPRLESELASTPIIPTIEERYCRIKHSVNLGDIIAALPACKKYYEVTKNKIIFSQQVNQRAAYYEGAIHPTKDEQGNAVCVNEPMWKMMKPLVESQEYIHAFERYEGQQFDLDFDVIRGKTFVGLPNLMIQSWIMYAFPDLDINLANPWIHLPDVKNHPIKKQVNGRAIINFTQRYRNDQMDYYFLKSYSPNLIFAGTEQEHYLFCTRWNLDIPYLRVKDFLEYAYAIKYSRFLLGGQSFGWNIAQGLGTPRIIELCRYAPNCQPFVGENSVGFFHQVSLEYYVKTFFNKF